MPSKHAEHLGDAVYADIEHENLKLYTSDGMQDLNVIFLEPEVIFALLRFIERHGDHILIPPKKGT